jgi:hypothetical protein
LDGFVLDFILNQMNFSNHVGAEISEELRKMIPVYSIKNRNFAKKLEL